MSECMDMYKRRGLLLCMYAMRHNLASHNDHHEKIMALNDNKYYVGVMKKAFLFSQVDSLLLSQSVSQSVAFHFQMK